MSIGTGVIVAVTLHEVDCPPEYNDPQFLEGRQPITNLKKFEEIIKTLAKFDKWNKKNSRRPFNGIIYFSDGKLYVTQGQVMGIIDVLNCVDFVEGEEFVFPSDMIAKKSIGKDIDGKLVVDGITTRNFWRVVNLILNSNLFVHIEQTSLKLYNYLHDNN